MRKLESYRRKRDFARTPEPGPEGGVESQASLRFVVQKHAARRLHYDFRLELDGVLKSWAVPKGPSVDPQQKRFAVLVEDHPLDYATFEGVISEGNYGAGHVIVWDTGIYSPDDENHLSFGDRGASEERMRRQLEAGKLSITLRGHKLRGSWTLVRTAKGPTEWLLIKHRDAHADPEREVLEREDSVLTGATLTDLRAGRAAGHSGGSVREQAQALGRPAPYPTSVKPMLARLVDGPFSHPGWLFEPKLDGYRIVAFVEPGRVTLRSRNGKDLTSRLPEVARELAEQAEEEMVLDGEVVALNSEGRPDFGRLQEALGRDRRLGASEPQAPLVYYPFDLLYLAGASLRQVPLVQRKSLLGQALVPGEAVRPVEFVEGSGEAFYEAATALGLEGMLAKRKDSSYEPGARSAAWLKVKAVQSQDFVVGGYTPGEGARASTLGAVLVGLYDDGKLQFAGRVGSGFDQSDLDSLLPRMAPLHTSRCPFDTTPDLQGSEAQWVRPELVARVKFSQWTKDELLRAPVFEGLREDAPARSVTREEGADVRTLLGVEAGAAEGPQSETDAVLAQLSGREDKALLELGGERLSLTNLNKELWPATSDAPAVTKRDMIRYYVQIAPALLPHLRDRPMTLTRYPNGIEGKSFYQKHWGGPMPGFVRTVSLFSSHREGDGEYILVDNLATLVWLAQLADIELHPWLSRVVREPDALHTGTVLTGSKEAVESSVLNHPDFLVFDLDPYTYSGKEAAGAEPELNRRAFSQAVEVAHSLRELLEGLTLTPFLKTSGKTGLHIYVPVLRQYDFSVTRRACQTVGQFLLQQRFRDVTLEWSVEKRTGKVFLDYNQNSRSRNMAAAYSLRPQPGAPVSTPLSWEELEHVFPTDFTIWSVPQRVERLGDLWGRVLESKHDLRGLLEG